MYIGSYPTEQGLIRFFEDGAQCTSLPDEKRYPINLPETEKTVKELLHDIHFTPEYSEETESVQFQRVAHENWTIFQEHAFKDEVKDWIILQNGNVSYIMGKKIRTWNWKDNSLSVLPVLYKPQKILENEEGELVILDDENTLHFEDGSTIPLEFGSNIVDVTFLHSSHYLLHLEKGTICIFDIKKPGVLQIKHCDGFLVSNRSIVYLQNGEIIVSRYSPDENHYVESEVNPTWPEFGDPNDRIHRVDQLSENKLLLVAKKSAFILDTETLESEITKPPKQTKSLGISGKKPVYFQSGRPEIRYVTEENKWETKGLHGSYPILATTQFSDGTFAYSTDTRKGAIHLLDMRGGKNETILEADQCKIEGLSVLPNGFLLGFENANIAAHSHRRFFVLKPEEVPFPMDYKRRLFIGESDFSYTEALIDKHLKNHPMLPHAITATEYLFPPNDETTATVNRLQKRGVTVQFGIDAHEIDQIFRKQRFERIQWNCPFVITQGGLSSLLPGFFRSASALQQVGDRIHVTLCQEKESEYWKTRQVENRIVEAATNSSYSLIKKRNFDARYPGYIHKMSNGERHHIQDELREFVFKKIELPSQDTVQHAQELKEHSDKEYDVVQMNQEGSLGKCVFECDTDSDSSDYEL